MALNPEWSKRINHWRHRLAARLYTPLGELDITAHITTDQLRPDAALERPFVPMPRGTKWGAKWEYAWLRASLTVPESAAGGRLVFRVRAGDESVVFVDGVARGAFDKQHQHITLAQAAEPGRTYDILLETYAGHGLRTGGGGPQPWGTESVPEPPATQAELTESDFGLWHEQAYGLLMDVNTLWHLRQAMADRESLRVAEIDAGLRDFTRLCDLELPPEEFDASVAAARQRLAPLLACRNGSTAPRFFAFGHAHIDTAWLWPLAETHRKCERTFGTQLELMDEYPQYKFLCSQPHQYRWIEQHNPAMFQRIVHAIARGQWIAEGAMWIEADTNLSGGEALIRQFVHGKRYFRGELGVDSRMLWLPDVFGYAGQMPQIMRGCEVDYFSTQKIFWNYNGGEPFPYNTFTWVGIDGTGVLSHMHNDYNAPTDPATTLGRWAERRQKDGLDSRLYPFGHGDGGGGPTRDHLEYLQRTADLEGAPKMSITHPNDFFEDLIEHGYPDDHYVGELYFQCHRGTYTSQAKTKRGNRKSEFALREAEMWAVAAAALRDAELPLEKLDELWKLVLLNQFHDILPGSSIQRVYEEAEADYTAAMHGAMEITDRAIATIGADGRAIAVFNSLNWPRRELIELPEAAGLTDPEGNALPVQPIGGRMLVEVDLPSCGWTTLSPANAADESDDTRALSGAGPAVADDRMLENDFVRVGFDDRGRIESLFDKTDRRELAAGPCNELKMYKDVPAMYDAWDIDSLYRQTPVELDAPAEFEITRRGPLEAQLVIRRSIGRSTLTQTVSLRRFSRRIDFQTVIEWNEQHKLLKVNFPVAYHSDEALHEIQFGHLARPTHQSRQFDADRFEVCNHKWTALAEQKRGFAVLNDCKYGVDVDRNSINLTLLKSPLAPDMYTDRGTQEFTYAACFWHGPLADSDLVRQGYELNAPPVVGAGDAGAQALFEIDAPNIILEAVKPAEDGSGDVIVRLYEAMRTATRCTLSTTLPMSDAAETNMLERNGRSIAVNDGKVKLDFRPFEIKTLRLAR